MSVSVAVITMKDGPHVQQYVGTLSLMKRVEKVHVCDPSSSIFPVAKETLGERLVGTHADVAACLRSGPFAFALVALDNRSAPAAIRQVLDAGYHVFTEKTAARTAAEFRPLVDLAARKNLLIGMSYPNRYRPSVQEARRLMKAGVLGKLYGFYIHSIATQARLRNPPGNWTFHREIAGGGYLIWLGCHYLDLLRFITGEDVAEVGALSGRVSEIEFDVEDAISLAIRLEGGAVGAANFGYYLDNHPQFGSKQSQITLWGELGWMRLQPGEDSEVPLEVYSAHPQVRGTPYHRTSFTLASVPKAYGNGWGLAFLEDFLSAALGKADPPIVARDAEAVLQIIDAAYAAARDRRIVTVAT